MLARTREDPDASDRDRVVPRRAAGRLTGCWLPRARLLFTTSLGFTLSPYDEPTTDFGIFD